MFNIISNSRCGLNRSSTTDCLHRAQQQQRRDQDPIQTVDTVCHCALLHETDLGCKREPGFWKQRTRQDFRKRGIKNGNPLYSMIRADGGGGVTVVVGGVKVCESISIRFVLENTFVASYNTRTEKCSLVYAVRKNPADPQD